MATAIANWFLAVFHNTYLSVFFISIIPMIEVRGAIPIGVQMGMNIWVSYVFATLSALVIAPILIVILKPILKALKKTKIFKKIATAIEDMFFDKASKLEGRIQNKNEGKVAQTAGEANFAKIADSTSQNADSASILIDSASQNAVSASGVAQAAVQPKRASAKDVWKKMFGIFLFVAIPLPMTGVWTGTAVAVFLNMKWYQILPAVVLGNFVAGAIITALTVLLGDKVSIILYVLFAFVLISVVAMLFGMYQKSKKQKAKLAEAAKNEENNASNDEKPQA